MDTVVFIPERIRNFSIIAHVGMYSLLVAINLS